MGKKFTCKSDAQRRAIAAYYARKRDQEQNASPLVPNGTVLFSRDYYFAGTDGESRKGRYAITLDSNSDGDLCVGKVTHSKKANGIPVDEYFDKDSKVLPGGLYVRDNGGSPIRISDKFEIRTSKGVVAQIKIDEIIKMMLEDNRFGKSNLEKLNELKKK